MALQQERDVVLCRNHARRLAAEFQFTNNEQIAIATAISEIARNAFSYARDVTAEFSLQPGPASSAAGRGESFVCMIKDRGKGIPNLQAVLDGTYRSTTGMGMGIIGARRLMDQVDIETTPQGTSVRLIRKLPRGVLADPAKVRVLAEALKAAAQVNPLDEVAEQNRELLRTLREISDQREEVSKINEELNETNRGVVALYDELDTVYRVGRVVASKLDLDSLLQAITDATTEVCGAEYGAFYLRETASNALFRRAASGPLAAVTRKTLETSLECLLGKDHQGVEVRRVDDLTVHGSPIGPLDGAGLLRSYLAVPVIDSTEQIAGCLVFAHRAPEMFTERSERILASVAIQASIGLENARLYHDVRSASAAKDQFLAVLSHELRTPLNPVFAVLASLEENPALPEEVRADLLVMRRNLQLEARLIDDLLDLTRIVKGKVPLRLEVVDVHEILRLAYETCMAAVERTVNVSWRLEASRSLIQGDAARLQQVFWNMLNNAVKFTPPAGVITIQTHTTDEGTVCIRMSDTGRGIEPEALKRIFQPFEQENSVIPVQFGGLGLGLAITRSIIDAHGGAIRAESAGPGKGASFVVELALTDASPAATGLAQPASRPVLGDGVRVLLVDDHADTRNSLQRLLARRGFQTTLAGSCQEALAQAAAQEFDLLISDLGLPDGSGHDLMRSIRASHPDLAGIALSGYGMESDVMRSHEAGFSAHLTKPLDFAVLQATIEKALSGSRS